MKSVNHRGCVPASARYRKRCHGRTIDSRIFSRTLIVAGCSASQQREFWQVWLELGPEGPIEEEVDTRHSVISRGDIRQGFAVRLTASRTPVLVDAFPDGDLSSCYADSNS
jgi:hypothetical protein